MQAQVLHFVVHTPAQAREIISEAGKIADELGGDTTERQAVFEEACRLLGMRVSVPVQPQEPGVADLVRLLREGAG